MYHPICPVTKLWTCFITRFAIRPLELVNTHAAVFLTQTVHTRRTREPSRGLIIRLVAPTDVELGHITTLRVFMLVVVVAIMYPCCWIAGI
jgi:hypothetical protein